MNILQLQSKLKNVPDDALISYVQNPDGQVPSFLALSELTRRKELRGTSAQAEMPTQTVADEVMASTVPGIDNLPIRDDMFQEESYANGGIVSFAGGGDPYYEKWKQYQKVLKDPSLDPAAYSSSFQRLLPDATAEAQYATAKQSELQRLAFLRGPGFFSTTTPQERAAYEKRDKLISQFRQGKFDPMVQPAVQVTGKTEVGKTKANKTEPPVVEEVAESPTPVNINQGISSLPAEPSTTPAGARYEEPSDLSKNFDSMMQKERTPQENMAEMQKLIGVDPNRAKLEERLAGMQAKAAKDEEQAPWMALAEAGLGIAAGSSPFALQNIAEGGKQGIKSLAAAKERAIAAEEKQFEAANKLAQADEEKRLTAIKYGVESSEAQKAGNRATTLAKTNYQANRAADKAKMDVQAKQFEMEYKLKNIEIKQKDREIGLVHDRALKQLDATVNQNERLLFQSRVDLYSNIAKESNDALDRLYEMYGNALLNDTVKKDEIKNKIIKQEAIRDSAITVMNGMGAGFSEFGKMTVSDR